MTRLQKIIKKLTTRLGAIKKSNGYRTDAGQHTILIDCEVDPERVKKEKGTGHDSGIVIQVQPAEAEDVKLGTKPLAHWTQDITIYAFRKMTDRADWFGDAQELDADIKQAIFGKEEDQLYYRQKIGLRATRIASAQATVPGYSDEYIGVEVTLSLDYVENLSAPWEAVD